ncbi:MAG TPA: energy transducer TonB [Pyrinomonadaceae bacterium]|nr:energy transducer TonB [Pyrinomonadaceae bacterium]
MNSFLKFYPQRIFIVTLLAVTLGTLGAQTCVYAQTPASPPAQQVSPQPSPEPADAAAGEASVASAEAEAVQKRLARARSLAAIGKLAAAAGELDALRSSTKEDSLRDVARVLLMAIFVEMPDYARAASLLDEAFGARTQGQTNDEATHAYFALAGQTVNSVRTHLERYRAFGINVSDASDLSADANSDLNQLRGLLERLSTQAKQLHDEQLKGGDAGTRGLDAAALLEDAATVRMRIARNEQDRAEWQSVVSEARQHLFSSEMRIASISEIPAARPTPVVTQPATNTSAPPKSSSAPAKGGQRSDDSAKKSSKKSQAQTAANAAPAPNNAQPPAQQPPAAQSPDGAARMGSAPVAVGSLAQKAKQKISPTYPSIARAARVTGVVTVYLVVNEKGEVENVQKLEGPLQLQQAAADAARRWRFNPTVIDGQPVRVTGYLSFNFAL